MSLRDDQLATLKAAGKDFDYYNIANLDGIDHLPYSLKVLVENLVRNIYGSNSTDEHVKTLLDWDPNAEPSHEIQFTPSRVIMQDFTGVPCIVDLATMRDAENGFTDDNGDEVETFSIAIPEYAEGERPGTTRVLEEHGNDYWLDLIHGTPAFTPDGRLICAMNDMDVDTNRLTVDGTPFTPAGLQEREVLDGTDDDVLCVVQRTPEILPESDLPFLWQSNASDHDARSFDVVSIRYDGTWEPLTYAPGQWSMSRAGNGCVVTGRGMDDATVQMQH